MVFGNSEETDAQLAFADRLVITKAIVGDIADFVRGCGLEWRVVESVRSPALDALEVARRCILLVEALKSAAEVAPNTRHPDNSLSARKVKDGGPIVTVGDLIQRLAQQDATAKVCVETNRLMSPGVSAFRPGVRFEEETADGPVVVIESTHVAAGEW
jgi:hypothetical protein